MGKNEWFTAVDLQLFTSSVLNTQDGKAPEFIRKSERIVSDSLQHYTLDITQQDASDVAAFVEEYAGKVLDAVSEANCIYFENGMKFGARMLMQLLGNM